MSNDKFPLMVYSHPGNEKIEGQGFATHVVHDDDELTQALEGGFHLTIADALKHSKVNDNHGASSTPAIGESLSTEVDKLKADLEEGLKKLETERKELEDAREKVDLDTAAVTKAITNLEKDRDQLNKDRAALDAEVKAVKEGREALDADRKAFETAKAANKPASGKK